MSAASGLEALGDLSPVTVYAYAYFVLLNVVGLVIVLRPENLLWFRSIQPVPLLDQPGWVGLLLLVGAPNLLLLSAYVRDR